MTIYIFVSIGLIGAIGFAFYLAIKEVKRLNVENTAQLNTIRRFNAEIVRLNKERKDHAKIDAIPDNKLVDELNQLCKPK
jgi:Mg2+/citrate symporter